MSLHRIVARNAFWNWGGLIVQMLAGFVISPLLVNRMGDTSYGLWLLIGSLTNYFGLLDLGLRGSVGRNVAYYRAKGDGGLVNQMVSGAFFLLAAAGVVAAVVTLVAVECLTRIFPDIPADQVGPSKEALLIVGLTFAASLPINSFDAILWGFQRFDLINAVDIVAVAIRTALTYSLIGQGYGLVTLAWITLLTTALQGIVKGIAILAIEPGLKIGPRWVTRTGVAQLFNFGAFTFLQTVARLVTSQLSNLVIGAWLGVAVVTPYGIVSRLVAYGASLVSSTAGVLTPVATAFHAGDRGDEQRRLFVDGCRFGMMFSLFFAINYLLLGRPLIEAWMGPSQAYTASYLYILAAGEVVPMSQLVSAGILQGMGRPGLLALLLMADGVGVLAGIAILSGPLGLTGVCIAFAASGFLFRGVLMAAVGARLLHVSPGELISRGLIGPVVAAIPPAALLAGLVSWRTPTGWAMLFAYGIAFTLAFLVALAGLIGFERTRALLAARSIRAAES